eukprot:3501639-Rhodomonas_salina.2
MEAQTGVAGTGKLGGNFQLGRLCVLLRPKLPTRVIRCATASAITVIPVISSITTNVVLGRLVLSSASILGGYTS